MSTKSFRFDWYPKEAHTDLMLLSPEEIGVLIQICNLIYLNHGPIENNGKWIARNMDDFGTAKCNRVIKILIEKGHIYLTEDQKISKKMCERQIEIVEERREFYAVSGTKGGKKSRKSNKKLHKNHTKPKDKSEQNQYDDLSIETEPIPISSKASLVIEEMPDLNLNTLEQFFQHRDNLGKPIHKNFVPNIIQDLKELSDTGNNPNLVMQQSIKNGWSSLRPVENFTTIRNGRKKSQTQDLRDQAFALMEKYSDQEEPNGGGII